MTDVQVKIELGHEALPRTKPTAEGFTHDWTVYVRGPDQTNIANFVKKVVFHLHPTFENPKRVCKEPPYHVSEHGYAGFQVHIDIYFKSKAKPKKQRFIYNLYLKQDSVSYSRCEKLIFRNPTEKFRKKLLKAGGANNHGIGVVGVVEADFLEPIHNKQDFNRTDKYSAFMQNASMKLNDYFYEKTQHINPDRPTSSESSQLPDWKWAQCDNCLQWRRLPTGYTTALPTKWFCMMNPDAAFNRCDIAEEPEDDDEALQPTYKKTFKKTQEEKRRKLKFEEERKLKEKEEQLKEKEEQLKEKEKQVKKIAKQQKELAEVSSSQDKVDRKPTVADLEKAKISITAYQKQVQEKERPIKQLEQQQKQVEEKSRAMLHMAESLKLSTDEGSNLYEKIQEMSDLGTSTVTSSSAFMQNASMKLNDYFYEKTQHINPDRPTSSESSQLPDWKWAQCDNCLQWRRLPTGYTTALPTKWFCMMNPDAAFNHCDIAEEPEDDDEALQPTYKKTFKKTQEEKRRKLKFEEELSSSQDKVDRKPTVADLEKAKISITAYQKQVQEIERTIKQLEQQQKQVEEKSRAMLHMAESLKLSTDEGSNLYEKIQEMSDLGTSTVTSSSGSSHGLRAPKRKHDMVSDTREDKAEPGFKMVKIKTEDGGSVFVKVLDSVIDLTLNESDEELTQDTTGPTTEKMDDSEQNKDNRPEKVLEENETCNNNKETNQDKDDEETDKEKDRDKDKVADTNDKLDTSNVSEIDDSSEKDNVTANKQGESSKCSDTSSDTNAGPSTTVDIKPDKKELDKKLTEMSEVNERKVFVENCSQTVPTIVKFASPEEVDLLKLSPVEQKANLLLKTRELDETKKGMASLQENVWKLLKLIVPDIDYGEPQNIEKIILDFIKVKEEQESQ